MDYNTLLTYPDFNETFKTQTDDSGFQLGMVIIQKGKLIAFCSIKLNDAQRWYTVTEIELLRTVETLKEFRTMLLGHKLIIYTNHKNTTYKTFITDRVLIWRLILEEYAPHIEYIKDEKI